MKSFDDFDFYRKRYVNLRDLSPSALEVLKTFREQPEIRLQRKDVVEITGLPRATVSVALKTLTAEGFIQLRGRGAGVRYQLIF